MTTIAYRDGVMAADSQTTAGEVRRGATRKVFQLLDGSLVGFSGGLSEIGPAVQWFAEGKLPYKRPRLPEDASLLVIEASPSGEVSYYRHNLIPQLTVAAFHAIGSGNEFALGAMAMGANAQQAVAVAAEFDIYTGGRITTLSLHQRTPERSGTCA